MKTREIEKGVPEAWYVAKVRSHQLINEKSPGSTHFQNANRDYTERGKEVKRRVSRDGEREQGKRGEREYRERER